METGVRYQVGAAELAGAQDVLRFVRSLSDPQAEAIARQLERLVVVEMALRKLVGAVDEYVINSGRPMTLHRERWEAMRSALAEGKARLRQ